MEMDYYMDLLFSFLDILVHMVGVVLLKVAGYMISVKIYNMARKFFGYDKQEEKDNAQDLFDPTDSYWKNWDKKNTNEEEWEDLGNPNDGSEVNADGGKSQREEFDKDIVAALRGFSATKGGLKEFKSCLEVLNKKKK